MRTTLTIDNDVLSAARDIAKLQHRTVGGVISDMARKGMTLAPPAPLTDSENLSEPDAWLAASGFTTFGDDDTIITNEDIDRIREDIGV
jgi:hypothetical protein